MADLVIDYTGLKLGEKKDLKTNWEAKWAAAQSKVQQKFGADWKLIIEWPQMATVVTDESNRKYFGAYVVEKYAEKLGDEISKMDDDVVEAIVDRCTDKKLVITIDNGGIDYPAGRYGVEFGDSLKVTIAKDRWGYDYPYGDDYTVNAFALKHF